MPYIKKDEREALFPYFASIMRMLENAPAGHINYVFSEILWNRLRKHMRYSELNQLIGVLECIKLELYRRLGSPYEDEKIKENGDIG